jgi:hypothetical protein
MAHKLPPLRFGYDALEPYIDAETMELHHDKHHKAYVDNLNKALEPYPQLAGLAVEDLLHRLDQVPETIRTAVRNNGGGHLNHQLFWDILGPRAFGAPKGDRRCHQEGLRLVRAISISLYRRGHKTVRLGMGVSRREPSGAPPRDRVGEIIVQGSGREEGRRRRNRPCEVGRVAALLPALAPKSGGHAILILESERGE